MRSQLIEYLRFSELETGMLRKDDRYLVVKGNEPVREITIPVGHADFMRRLKKLRYGARIDQSERREAIDTLSGYVTAVLGTQDAPTEPLQIDLVANAAELSALPFELAVDAEGRPAFATSDPPLVLTRRIRQRGRTSPPAWATEPRILFVSASPAGAGLPVPFHDHQDALYAALEPWVEPLHVSAEARSYPNHKKVLTKLRNASLDAIRAVGVRALDEGKPYTHLHILAHGCPIGDGWDERFGLALHTADGAGVDEVSPEELCAAIEPFADRLGMVTLAVCDGGNQANSVAGGASVAHLLHRSGIEVVVASQFPLTFDGSTLFTRTFYSGVLSGQDVRHTLHRVRSELYDRGADVGHDWASLVAYVQLAPDYEDRLLGVQLRAELASLRTAQRWFDDLHEHGIEDPSEYERVGARLQERITNLQRLLAEHRGTHGVGTYEEHLGLLGSAEKRLAELWFRRARLGGDPAQWKDSSRQALERSRGWYRRSSVRNLSHHWTGVQYLCLEAVLNGRIADTGLWHAFRKAADIDSDEQPDDPWPCGSLAELYLLAPLAGVSDMLDEAKAELAELIRRAHELDGEFPIESTERQLRRYVEWWTVDEGYFDGQRDLAAEATELLAVIAEHT
jgi:hypothetical protein